MNRKAQGQQPHTRLKFRLENVAFIQKENERRISKEFALADCLPQFQGIDLEDTVLQYNRRA